MKKDKALELHGKIKEDLEAQVSEKAVYTT